MANRFVLPDQREFTDSGVAPSASATLDFYTTGTFNRLDTFTDNALATPHANPVVADSAGRFPEIFMQDADYRAVLTVDTVQEWQRDLVHGGLSSGAITPTGATTARSLEVQAALYPFFNVKDPDYGATGDGVTDDTTEIQAAIDAAEANGGGIVFFPQGEYIISSALTIDNEGVHLVGVGGRASGTPVIGSVIKAAAAMTGSMVFFSGIALPGNHRWNSGIEHMRIDGNAENVVALDIRYQSQFDLKNVVAKSCKNNGVYIEETHDSQFYALSVLDCGDTGTTKAAMRIFNGATDNCNFLRFPFLRLENNDHIDLFIDSTGASATKNHAITCNEFHFEEGAAGISLTAVKIDGGTAGAVTFRDGFVSNYGAAAAGRAFDLVAGKLDLQNVLMQNTALVTGSKAVDCSRGAGAVELRMTDCKFENWDASADWNGVGRDRIYFAGCQDRATIDRRWRAIDGAGNRIHVMGLDNGVWAASTGADFATFNIADDAFIKFKPFYTGGIIEVITPNMTTNGIALYVAKPASTATQVIHDAGFFDVTTGALTGTTGIDTNLTVSTHTDEHIYIENRTGSVREVTFRIKGGLIS